MLVTFYVLYSLIIEVLTIIIIYTYT